MVLRYTPGADTGIQNGGGGGVRVTVKDRQQEASAILVASHYIGD